jgi:hypothetical protein
MRAPLPATFLMAALCCGCAEAASVDGDATRSPAGQAIHLDDRQRIVLIHPADAVGTLCAEPNPDALAAFASSLGGDVSVADQGAKPEANALDAGAASIGLRTQSVALMRDTLNRACEAYYNGRISQPQMMALMARFQDLSASIASDESAGVAAARQAALEQQLQHELRKAEAGDHARSLPPSPGQRAH